MFGENTQPAAMTESRLSSAPQCYPTAAPPSEYGVRSAPSDLISETKTICGQIQELKIVLGIATPENTEQSNQGVESRVGAIGLLSAMLHGANNHLSDCIRHLRT